MRAEPMNPAHQRLAGKVAIVTGAGSGFGEGIALCFAQHGAAVLINDVDAASASRVAGALSEQGHRATAVPGNVSRQADMTALLANALEQFGKVDIVVNNAGVSHRNQWLLDVSEEEFDRVYAVNVKSMFTTAKTFVPYFQSQGGGVFVNIASTAGVRPRPGLTWYNGSKGAVITISRSMAVELAPYKIRVNVINPVAGETPLLGTFMGQDTPEMRAKFVGSIPLGRLSQPRDIAQAALFLASDEAEFITGACLEVDGGRCV